MSHPNRGNLRTLLDYDYGSNPDLIIEECNCSQIIIIDDNSFNIMALDLSLEQLKNQSNRLRSINLKTDSVRYLF